MCVTGSENHRRRRFRRSWRLEAAKAPSVEIVRGNVEAVATLDRLSLRARRSYALLLITSAHHWFGLVFERR